MLDLNIQLFGGRGSGGGNNPGSGEKIPNITSAKTQKDLNKKLKEEGLVLDSAYQSAQSGEEVVLYRMDKNGKVRKRYVGTYNQYSDGGREIVNIKEKALIDEVVIEGKRYKL